MEKVNLRPKKRKLLLFLCLLCLPFMAFAQKKVSGKVLDSSGMTAIGANVIIKGTSTGVITDLDGNFTIDVPSENSVIQISYIGFQTVELPVKGKKFFNVVLQEESNTLEEVTVVAYGVQKKETLTGAITSVDNEQLLASPNASVANSLAGKVTGLSSVQSSGQPGAEDPKLFVRGVGSLSDEASSPLILVDGVERSFFQMDPNEIESITVLKDASATAVFGVRGANGVILVTTKRGEEGKARISVSSSVGIQAPTKMLEMVDSYTYALMHNEQTLNDGGTPVFDGYTIERFKLGDNPIMYPSIKWREYMMKDFAVQTQHNLSISGGTEKVRYFISLGYLYQDGLFKNFGQKELGYKYNRYNYRTNLDINISKSTILKLGIGGIVGDKNQPAYDDLWNRLNWSQPFSSAGIIDGYIVSPGVEYPNILLENPLGYYYSRGYKRSVSNTMNLDMHLVQKLDFLTKGLSVEVKGAYNTNYSFTKTRSGSKESYKVYYRSELENPDMSIFDPNYSKEMIYVVQGSNSRPGYEESTSRGRNWYLEASVRYNRKFGNHSVGALLLYNQDKKYYPSQYGFIPTAYVGLVGRATYNYKSRYMAEFNIGYNGSENFAPDKRFGTFPAVSLGYIMSEEKFMKNQKVFDFLKLRASVGLVGNDNMSNNRYLYLPDSYGVNKQAEVSEWKGNKWGYNFGYNNPSLIKGAVEQRMGNPDVTWETALKQNYGLDMHFLDNRLKAKVDFFYETRKDILINRSTIPLLTGLSKEILPVVNMGEVENKGYEIDLSWNDKIGDNFHYYVNGNMSYSRNKILFMDEVEPNEPYLSRTGQPVGTVFGYVAEGFYNYSDFTDESCTTLVEGLPVPQVAVYPGDVKYKDLNLDGVIDTDDQKNIGFPKRPNYVFGLNLGFDIKGFMFSMNWTGTAERSLVLQDVFQRPFMSESRALMQFHVDNRWTPDRADVATQPRFSLVSSEHNYKQSTLWVMDGSYLKLKNLTFGYTFSKNPLLKKIGISQLGIKFTGYNLLTFDHFGIMDPESNPSRYADTYPVVKIYNIGVNLTF